MKPLGVGLIGANPDRGWAKSSHIPALLAAAGEDFALVAAATSRPETADRAARKLGVTGYSDYKELIADPLVDIVTVSVKLPLHQEIVSAALDAGKHVYCEWPLGRTLDEATDLVSRARRKNVHTMIGLQSRASPVLQRLGQLIAERYVGDVLAVSVVASGLGWGGAIDEGNAYLLNADNGATLLTITGGHLLDAICHALGPLEEIAAYLPTRRSRVGILSVDDLARYRAFEATLQIAEPGAARLSSSTTIAAHRTVEQTSPDQLAIIGKIKGGIPLTFSVRGGMTRSSGLRIDITGTEGELAINGPAGVIQMMPLELLGARGAERELRLIAASDAFDEHGPIASNLMRSYRQFASDIRTGSRTVASFDDALSHQRMLNAIDAAHDAGMMKIG